MPHITHYLPEVEEAERTYIQSLTCRMSHDQLQIFVSAYRHQRKDPNTLLLIAIIGLVAIPGLQRFWLGQLRLGFLLLFSWGLLLVGSICDLVRYKTLALLYNQKVARKIVGNLQTNFEDTRFSDRPSPAF
jgi:hypothetical protein